MWLRRQARARARRAGRAARLRGAQAGRGRFREATAALRYATGRHPLVTGWQSAMVGGRRAPAGAATCARGASGRSFVPPCPSLGARSAPPPCRPFTPGAVTLVFLAPTSLGPALHRPLRFGAALRRGFVARRRAVLRRLSLPPSGLRARCCPGLRTAARLPPLLASPSLAQVPAFRSTTAAVASLQQPPPCLYCAATPCRPAFTVVARAPLPAEGQPASACAPSGRIFLGGAAPPSAPSLRPCRLCCSFVQFVLRPWPSIQYQ